MVNLIGTHNMQEPRLVQRVSSYILTAKYDFFKKLWPCCKFLGREVGVFRGIPPRNMPDCGLKHCADVRELRCIGNCNVLMSCNLTGVAVHGSTFWSGYPVQRLWLGIAIPGSRIPGSRTVFQSRNPGIMRDQIPGFRD